MCLLLGPLPGHIHRKRMNVRGGKGIVKMRYSTVTCAILVRIFHLNSKGENFEGAATPR